MIAAFIALAFGLVPQDEAWSRIWSELETLRAGRITPGEKDLLRGDLIQALQRGEKGAREELLRASLEGLSGRETSTVATRLADLEPSPFGPREQWFLADLLPPGGERAQLVLAALRSPAPLADWQVLLAWNAAIDELRALRLEGSALSIQEALHERYQAAWSAEDLALTYRKLGRSRDADDALASALAKEPSIERRAQLWKKRGLGALGFGDERAARDYLGRALAEGNEGAGLVLARLDLAKGRIPAARLGFQALILDRPPPDWAWRGWGTSLLPSAHAAPTSRPRPLPNE